MTDTPSTGHTWSWGPRPPREPVAVSLEQYASDFDAEAAAAGYDVRRPGAQDAPAPSPDPRHPGAPDRD